jgi:mannonate dehydratase
MAQEQMRVAIGHGELTDEGLRFSQQLGVSGVRVGSSALSGEKRWEFLDLVQLRTRVEAYSLRLEAIENTPPHFYIKAMLGLPGRDEQIENYQETIRNIGRAGIPLLGYQWMPSGVWRTSRTTPGRGGALVTSYDHDLAKNSPLTFGRVYTEEDMRSTYEYFIRAVVPVAEEAGVRLALHPCDPPVESVGGVARIFRSFEAFKWAMELVPSPNNGMDYCMGCWSEMGPDVIGSMRYFAERGKIFYVHFRDVIGHVPKFTECFLGEGNVDLVDALLVLKNAGFNGFVMDDHVPQMVGDSGWNFRGRAYSTGYIMGLLKAIERLA